MFKWIINIFKFKKETTVNNTVVSNTTYDVATYGVSNQQPDAYTLIINESTKKLNLLKIYVNYFFYRPLTDIYNQTKTIHNIFENNKDLKYNKLKQVHYMYTDNLLELLKNYKKSCDENEGILTSQIESSIANLDQITKDLKNIQKQITSLDNDKKKYSNYMSLQLNIMYNCLVDKFDDFRFTELHRLSVFSLKNDYLKLAYKIPKDLFNSLIEYDLSTNMFYEYRMYFIERQLMGKLNKNIFNIEFICMFKEGANILELFKIKDTDTYFIFSVHTGLYKIVAYDLVKNYMSDINTELGSLIADGELYELKITKLNNQKENINVMSDEVKKTLDEYLHKINEYDFLNNLQEIDTDRLNLEAVLKMSRLDV